MAYNPSSRFKLFRDFSKLSKSIVNEKAQYNDYQYNEDLRYYDYKLNEKAQYYDYQRYQYDQPPPYIQNYDEDHTTITVKEESKWTESISVRNNSIIFNIKERINVLYNIAIDEQIIFYKDVILDNSKRVRDLTIGPNDTFYMIRRAKVPRETSQETSKELHTCSNEGTVKVILPNRELEISVSSNDTVAVLEQKIFEKAGMDMSRKTITDGKACGYDKIYLKIVFRNKVISGSNRTLISWGIYPRGHDANYSVFNILFGMIKLGGG